MPWKPRCCNGISTEEDSYAFNNPIKIYTSSVVQSNDIRGGSTIEYTAVYSGYAHIKTKATRNFDNGVNISDTPTTIFTIRWLSSFDVTLSYWVLFKERYFKIRNIENKNEEDKYIKFTSIERGSKDIKVNTV